MKKFLLGVSVGVAFIAATVSMAAPGVEEESERRTNDSLGGVSLALLGPAVYDATGKIAGRYFPTSNDSAHAVVSAQGAPIFLKLIRLTQGSQIDATLLRWVEGQVFYASNDCSGPPLITSVEAPPGTRPAAVLRDASGNLIAYVGAKGPSSRQVSLSGLLPGAALCSRATGGGSVDVWPLERTVNISQLYPEPLSVH